MEVRRIKGGRYQDKSTGMFIPKSIAKHELSMKYSKPVKHHRKYPKMRAVNIIKIKQYKHGYWDLDLGHLGVDCSDLLYLGKYLTEMAMTEIRGKAQQTDYEYRDREK